MKLRHPVTIITALALAAGPAAVAKKPEDPGGKGKEKSAEAKSKTKGKSISLKGVVVSVDPATSVITLTVTKANKAGRSMVGSDVQFTAAKFNVADTNGDGAMDALDFAAGDKVHVKAKLAKDAAEPFAARKIVNQTQPEPGETETPEQE